MTDWAENAACRDADPEMFFPTRDAPWLATEARKLCAVCPVREDCVTEGLSLAAAAPPEWLGMWGGLTGRELKKFAMRERRAA